MRVLVLVALLASFALSASAQTSSVNVKFYTDAACATQVNQGQYPYTTVNGTSGASPAGNCQALTGTTPFIANGTTYIGGQTYSAPTTTNSITSGSYSFNLYNLAAGANATTACSTPAVANGAQIVASTAGVGNSDLSICTKLTTITGNTVWYARVGSSASTAAVSAAVAVFAAIASLATFSF